MKLTKRFIIDNDIVDFESRMGDIEVYSRRSEDEGNITFYFLRKDTVIQTLYVEAEYVEAEYGYISEVRFDKPK